jgi:hypothetical protein
MTYLFFNWLQFLPFRRARRPVYILQTTRSKRIFLKLEGESHFILRQAISRYQRYRPSIAA